MDGAEPRRLPMIAAANSLLFFASARSTRTSHGRARCSAGPPGRSIAVEHKGASRLRHAVFSIECRLPIESERAKTPFHRLMMHHDTALPSSGPARAAFYFAPALRRQGVRSVRAQCALRQFCPRSSLVRLLAAARDGARLSAVLKNRKLFRAIAPRRSRPKDIKQRRQPAEAAPLQLHRRRRTAKQPPKSAHRAGAGCACFSSRNSAPSQNRCPAAGSAAQNCAAAEFAARGRPPPPFIIATRIKRRRLPSHRISSTATAQTRPHEEEHALWEIVAKQSSRFARNPAR